MGFGKENTELMEEDRRKDSEIQIRTNKIMKNKQHSKRE